MKRLTERQDIAMAMNFGKYPVVKFDLADADDYGLKGCTVRVDAGSFSDGLPFTIKAELRVYTDQRKLTTSSWGACLTDSLSYFDYTDMIETAQAPLIKPDQEVVVAIYDSRNNMAYAPMIVKTGKSVRRHCQTPLDFEPVDMTTYLLAAGCELH